MNNHFTSVIMSVYNNEDLVGSSIDSILQQTYKNFEFLIIDDGSTDNTYEILQEKSLHDKRIKIYRNKINLGLTKSLNVLINISRGDLIARQDSDDLSKPSRLKKQIEYIDKYNLDYCTARAEIRETNKVMPRYSYYLPKKIIINYKNPFIHGTLIIKKSVILEIGMYDEYFYFSQDYKLFRDLLDKNYKFKFLRAPLYELNIKDNISNKYFKQQEYYANHVRKRTVPEVKKIL